VFAQSAASALRRAGADPKAVARLEELTRRKLRHTHEPSAPVAFELPLPQEEPLARVERLRPRRRPSPPVSPLGGIDLGDRFRLSEPPEISEPHGPVGFNANWIAFAALLGGAVYYLLR